jgi:hypothetical protein
MVKARTIVEDECVSQEVAKLIKKYPRIDDLWEAWKWRLSRDPITDATPINDNVMIIKTSSSNLSFGVPSIAILYSFSEDEVHVLGIKHGLT